MVKYLYGRISANQWLGSPTHDDRNSSVGVLLRRSRGNYAYAPDEISGVLLSAVRKINAEVAFTMRTETVDVVISSLEPFQTELPMNGGSQLQIMDSLNDVATTTIKKFQYACLIRKERMLLLWHDDLQHIIPHASRMEEKLLSLVRIPILTDLTTTDRQLRSGDHLRFRSLWVTEHNQQLRLARPKHPS